MGLFATAMYTSSGTFTACLVIVTAGRAVV